MLLLWDVGSSEIAVRLISSSNWSILFGGWLLSPSIAISLRYSEICFGCGLSCRLCCVDLCDL